MPAARRLLLSLVAAVASACSSSIAQPPCCTGPSPIPSTVLIGAGDIAVCNSNGAVATAALIDGHPNATVFTAGDNVYPSGHPDQWRDCYEPTWGRHKQRTYPTAGNHDYETQHAKPYYDYWGDRAGPRDQGYYTYTVGTWRIYAINSEIDTRPGSPQYQWLQSELSTRTEPCAAAIWHKPLFSSGVNGPNSHMREIYRLLFDANAEIVINGHDHVYERFGPQDHNGVFNGARGIRQFTVGTGGVPNTVFPTVRPNSELRVQTWGVLKLELNDAGYRWDFLAVTGNPVRDSGVGSCH
jgi:hypothetical protein